MSHCLSYGVTGSCPSVNSSHSHSHPRACFTQVEPTQTWGLANCKCTLDGNWTHILNAVRWQWCLLQHHLTDKHEYLYVVLLSAAPTGRKWSFQLHDKSRRKWDNLFHPLDFRSLTCFLNCFILFFPDPGYPSNDCTGRRDCMALGGALRWDICQVTCMHTCAHMRAHTYTVISTELKPNTINMLHK